MQQETRKLSSLLGSIFLFLLFLYGFIPFEMPNPTSTQNFKLLCIVFIISYVLFAQYYRYRYRAFDLAILLFFAFLFVVGEMISKERDGIEFIFSILFGHIVANALHNSEGFRSSFLIALKWLIVLSIILLVVQYAVLLLTGNVLDIHGFIFPFSEARISVNTMFGFYRMGGMYIEPGTYSNMMYIFLILYMVLSKKTDSLLLYAGVASIVLTGSVWGLIFGSYMATILFIEKLLKTKEIPLIKKIFTTLILIVVYYASISYLQNSKLLKYAENKMNTNNPSVNAKELTFTKYQESYSDFLILGEGFSPEFYVGIPSPQDAGLLLNITVIFGVLAGLIIAIVFLVSTIRCCSWVLLFATLPVFISKLYYVDRVFWLLFFVMIFGAYSGFRYKDKAS